MATPGPLSSKNLSLSPAASDLGLGDSVAQQLQDQLAERKKKLSLQTGGIPGASPFSSSVTDLLGGFMGGLSG